MPFKPLLSLLALSLGFLGVVACGTGLVVVGSVGSRFSRLNETVFDRVEESLAAVRDRVLHAQRRVEASTITTQDVARSLKERAQKKTSQRVESHLDIGGKAEQLTLALEQVDLWLEVSGTSIQSVQQALELGSSIGAPVDATLVDPLLGKLASLRNQLKQATETFDGLRERATDIAEGPSPQERMEQAAAMALRVVATLGDIGERLGELANTLATTRGKGQHLKSRTHAYIVMGQFGAVLLIVWMAAGQACVCHQGWKKYRQQRPAV